MKDVFFLDYIFFHVSIALKIVFHFTAENGKTEFLLFSGRIPLHCQRPVSRGNTLLGSVFSSIAAKMIN